MSSRLILLTLFVLPACATSGASSFDPAAQDSRPHYLMQGMIGANNINASDVQIDPSAGSVEDMDTIKSPMIGGAMQYPLSGDRARLGLEGGFTFGWKANTDVTLLSGGTVVVHGDTDMTVFDFFGGLYGELPIGEKMRVYAGAGPVLQWLSVDLDWTDPTIGGQTEHNNGFGTGLYWRAGFEFTLRPGTQIGLGYRYVETNADLGDNVRNIDLHEEQVFLTVTQSY